MNRAPFAAWRTLLAAGGAPAASHASLAREPARTGLLSPLAHSSLVRDARFGALVRPVALAAVLGRGLSNAGALREGAEEASPAGDDAAEREGARRAAQSDRDRQRSRRAAIASGGDARSSTQVDEGRQRRRPVPPPPRAPASRTRAGSPSTVPTDHAHAVRGGTSTQSGALFGGRLPGAPPFVAPGALPFEARRSAALHDVPFGDVVRGAAATPVVIGTAPQAVRRLLDLDAAPNTSPSGAQGAGRKEATPASSEPGHQSSAIDAVLARIAARDASRGAAGLDGRSSPSRHRAVTPALEGSASDEPAAHARVPSPPTTLAKRLFPETPADSLGGEGFRGLAARAMRHSDGAPPAVAVAASRLTREVHPMSDLPLDTLDAHVADSVTRILQREARRHGIDLAGSGT